MIARILTLLLFAVFTAASARAQDLDSTVAFPVNAVIFLKDGTQLRGVLLSESPVGARIRTDNLGEIAVTADKIESIEKNDNGFYNKGRYWFNNPHYTRYLFAPSALSLSKGEGYYQNSLLLLNSVEVGITDHFTMGGGFVLNPTFRDWQVLFLTPKVSFPTQSKVTFGIGALAIGVFNRTYDFDIQTGVQRKDGIETNFAGVGYGIMTIGGAERNGSVGLGWGFAQGEISASPVINLSYMSRLGRKVGVVTENWIIIPRQGDSGVGILSGGVRFFGEKMAVDLALWVPVGEDAPFFAFPYVDFVIKFGQKKRPGQRSEK
ncbi:hypothetical protein [Persicitalea jodogahamensis]|uniref:Uncharacterized protein n=1 Tax=Persicitalea jodogahamensis TaxID=402147 RepID=A0A8J3D1Y9_9BACT|nr:hypothetical protein [Persicitalea jodogahamensis]GHB55099.1 hypothetical protein GCM10007390_05310 [Persicitalea jodogahamensis]